MCGRSQHSVPQLTSWARSMMRHLSTASTSRLTSPGDSRIKLTKYSRRVRHYETIELCDLQTGGGDELVDWPIHVAPAADELGDRIETILESCDSRIVAAPVLEKHIVGLGF